MLDNRLQSNFVSKNVVNLSRRNLTVSEVSLLSKGLNFVPTSSTIDKANLNPFVPDAPFLYTLKTSENRTVL